MSDTVVVQVTESTVVKVPTAENTVATVVVQGEQGIQGVKGDTGAQGSSGVISVTAPITNSGTSTAAIIGLDMSYLGAYDTTNQTIASTTTAYKLSINTAYTSHGITLSNSRMTFAKAGTYNLTFSIQFTSGDNAPQDATVWTKWNNVNAPFTSSTVTVPAKHANVNGKTVMQVSFIGSFAANDYLEIWWHADSTSVSVETLPAGTNPATPASPGVIALLQQIG